MTDEMRELLRGIRDEQHDQRNHMQALASNVNAICVTCARIEEQLSTVYERLSDHSARLDEECLEVAAIKRSAAWVRAWSAGAAAAVLGIFGALAWVAARLPEIVDVAKTVGGK